MSRGNETGEEREGAFLLVGSAHRLIALRADVAPVLYYDLFPTAQRSYCNTLLSLLFTWPFVLVGQLIMAIRFLFSPPRRLMGLGMLTMLVLLAVAILLGWLPSPFSLLGLFD